MNINFEIMSVNGTGTGFINGSDILFELEGKAVGHCTSHKTTYTSETKERAYKPVATAEIDESLWTDRSVVKLSISTTFEGLRHYGETEGAFKRMLRLWRMGKPIRCKAFERGSDDPYMVIDMVMTQLEENNPAQDDATYSGQLENAGAPVTFDPSKLTGETLPPTPIESQSPVGNI